MSGVHLTSAVGIRAERVAELDSGRTFFSCLQSEFAIRGKLDDRSRVSKTEQFEGVLNDVIEHQSFFFVKPQD